MSLTGTPAGGIWSSSSATVASVGSTGIVTGLSAGTATIYYNNGGCYAYRPVTVNIPPVTIFGSSTVCTGSAITLTDAVGGGAWSTSNPAVATVSTTGVVVGVAVGTVTIYYSVGSCAVSKSVTVNPTPAPITGPSVVSVGGTITLSDATPGGLWICGSPIATITTTGMVTGVSSGTVNIYYTVGGCGVFKTISVMAEGSGAPLVSGPSQAQMQEVTNAASKAGGESITASDRDGTVAVYPNPTNGSLNIEWKDQVTGDAQVIITDVTGRSVYQSILHMDNVNGLQQVGLSDLKSGIYLISIKSDAVHFSSKLVIQH